MRPLIFLAVVIPLNVVAVAYGDRIFVWLHDQWTRHRS